MPIDSTYIPSDFTPPVAFGLSYGHGISTAMVDSIAADTATGRIPVFIPVAEADSLRAEALADTLEAYVEIEPAPQGSHVGLPPVALAPSYTGSSALVALMTGLLVFAGIKATTLRRALASYRGELWSLRRRPNVFDDHRSTSLPAAALLATIFVVFGGMMLYNLSGLPVAPGFVGAATSMALLGAYYLFQLCAYNMVGYAFAGIDGRRQWLNGFAASQAYAGLGMVLPALLVVFHPEWRPTLVLISLAIYWTARAIFVAKGFRIFYGGYMSLLYFILYLCTLEIIPVAVVYRISAAISGHSA